MTVTKAVVSGILIASLVATSAGASSSSVLVLGVTSNSSSLPSDPVTSSPFNSSYFQPTPASSLTLGVMSNGGNSGFTMATPASASSAPAAVSYAPTPAPAASYSSPAPQSFVASTSSYSAPVTSSPSTVYDAAINFGAGPFPNSGSLTTGNAQAWFLSPAVDKLFGGVPNAQQQSSFDSTVLQRVQQTFSMSGVPVNLTDSPNAQAALTLSVVSNTANPNLPTAIGMTYLGGNGFHFIDNSAAAAQNVDQLEWIVAHNIAHELMLAFNVPENYDHTGNFIDARNASWSMITNPNSTFSPAAANALLAANFQNSGGAMLNSGAQLIGPDPVPEPSTVALWLSLVGVGLVVRNKRNASRTAAV